MTKRIEKCENYEKEPCTLNCVVLRRGDCPYAWKGVKIEGQKWNKTIWAQDGYPE